MPTHRGAAGVLALAMVTAIGWAGSGTTLASFTDFSASTLTVGAGVWAPDPPEACADILRKPHATIVWGTPGDDVLTGGNHPQVLMGLGGNDTLTAGNQGDCLVGGDGDDRLEGTNAKDVLIGGAGDDYLDGGNGKDFLDGGDDIDICLGGNGKDVVVNCESSSAAPFVAPLGQPGQDQGERGASSEQGGGPTVEQPSRPTPPPATDVQPHHPPADKAADPAADLPADQPAAAGGGQSPPGADPTETAAGDSGGATGPSTPAPELEEPQPTPTTTPEVP
ncbi:MAG: calcium-binding protein [Nocardioides sp.]